MFPWAESASCIVSSRFRVFLLSFVDNSRATPELNLKLTICKPSQTICKYSNLEPQEARNHKTSAEKTPLAGHQVDKNRENSANSGELQLSRPNCQAHWRIFSFLAVRFENKHGREDTRRYRQLTISFEILLSRHEEGKSARGRHICLNISTK